MLSRLFWVGIAGVALITGMVIQERDWLFGDSDRIIDVGIDRTVDRSVDRVTDRAIDRMEVVGSDGRRVEVSPETKRAFAAAIGRLVKAETNLAMLRIDDASAKDMQAAEARRDKARAEVDALKARIDGSPPDRDAVREQIRSDIRETVRDAVGN